MFTYILIVPDLSCVEVSLLHMRIPKLSVFWETKFSGSFATPKFSSLKFMCVDITIDISGSTSGYSLSIAPFLDLFNSSLIPSRFGFNTIQNHIPEADDEKVILSVHKQI